jgi:hypothetical protein
MRKVKRFGEDWGENENQEQGMDCAEMGSEDVGNPTGESFIRSLM